MAFISIKTPAGPSFSAYMAMPSHNQPAPAILVIQEIFGVNKDVRAKCDAWAAQGYLAIAPDLFWRQEADAQLDNLDQAAWDKAFGLLKAFDVDQGVHDLMTTLDTVRAMPDCNGQVGTVGYCLGGRMATLMAMRSNIDCAVSYYGVTIEHYLAETAQIKNPLMLHMAENDKYVSKDAQEQIKSVLGKNSFVQIHSYAGVDHAFSRIGGDHYNEAAATLANQRTMDFFKQYLRDKIASAA